MTPERFQQVRKLFAAALEREPGVRGAYLEQAWQRDPELRWRSCCGRTSKPRASLRARTSTPGRNSNRAPGSHWQTYRNVTGFVVVNAIKPGPFSPPLPVGTNVSIKAPVTPSKRFTLPSLALMSPAFESQLAT